MNNNTTSTAFRAASGTVLFLGVAGFLVGLWKTEMQLNEKGFYLLILLFGLFSAVSIQKAVRDRLEGIMVTNLYYGITWAALLIVIVLFTIGLINATLLPSEKGFYAFGFILSLFGAISVQKNTRDILSSNADNSSKLYSNSDNKENYNKIDNTVND